MRKTNNASNDVPSLPASSDFRQKILAAVRAEFLNALSHMDFEIEHKVKVDNKMAEGGKIDYMDADEAFSVKSASLKRKIDKDSGAFLYFVKIVVE